MLQRKNGPHWKVNAWELSSGYGRGPLWCRYQPNHSVLHSLEVALQLHWNWRLQPSLHAPQLGRMIWAPPWKGISSPFSLLIGKILQPQAWPSGNIKGRYWAFTKLIYRSLSLNVLVLFSRPQGSSYGESSNAVKSEVTLYVKFTINHEAFWCFGPLLSAQHAGRVDTNTEWVQISGTYCQLTQNVRTSRPEAFCHFINRGSDMRWLSEIKSFCSDSGMS